MSPQGYQRPDLWEPDAFRHLSTSGHSMPATWSLLPADLLLPGNSSSTAAPTAGSAAATNGHASNPSSPGRSPGPPAQQLWVHMPEGSYRWEEVADCPAYVRSV